MCMLILRGVGTVFVCFVCVGSAVVVESNVNRGFELGFVGALLGCFDGLV